MNLSLGALAIAVTLNLAYAILGIIAFTHADRKNDSGLSPILSLTLWWPFYNIYDEHGKRLCTAGRLTLLLTGAMYLIAWQIPDTW